MKFMMPPGFETELIYSFVIILCSLMIYFGTKSIYKLSSYKGINYFRKAFLFFAVALFFRYFIKFILLYFKFGRIFDFKFGMIAMLIFMYFSLIAIFYLIYSLMWKKKKFRESYLHITALIITIISLIFIIPNLYFIINLLLFIFLVYIVYTKFRKSKKKNLYLIYTLLLIFWILNIIDILVPNFLPFQILIYLASITIFMIITYRVLKKIG